mmetsp:Transcript_27359/g.83193  ORF Transcript_27359/g.83193 Transcript_27359/m.83193 type:complete len:201 (+) Transcript_27359:400-1002(+)
MESPIPGCVHCLLRPLAYVHGVGCVRCAARCRGGAGARAREARVRRLILVAEIRQGGEADRWRHLPAARDHARRCHLPASVPQGHAPSLQCWAADVSGDLLLLHRHTLATGFGVLHCWCGNGRRGDACTPSLAPEAAAQFRQSPRRRGRQLFSCDPRWAGWRFSTLIQEESCRFGPHSAEADWLIRSAINAALYPINCRS